MEVVFLYTFYPVLRKRKYHAVLLNGSLARSTTGSILDGIRHGSLVDPFFAIMLDVGGCDVTSVSREWAAIRRGSGR